MKSKYSIYILRSLPNICWPLKIALTKLFLKKVGKNVHFGPKCLFYNPNFIEIDSNVFMGDNSIISTIVPVKICNNVMFGPEVMIIGGDHNFSQIGIPMIQVKEGGENLPIIIEQDCWIGARAIILKGVNIREGSIIGAQSLVNKSILPYSINAGNPCRFVKPRFSLNQLKEHLSKVDTKYTIKEILDLYSETGKTIS